MCGRLGVRHALLTGSVTGTARNQILRGLANGEIVAVFGTHALIQERVRMRELALGVIDEQHRFGVFDRAKMKELGPKANLLMMTATPIPRSLAMSLFANLDVSFLDELPAGRTPIATEIYTEHDIERVHDSLRAEIEARRTCVLRRAVYRGRRRRGQVGVGHGDAPQERERCAARESARCTAG